jgi:solute carrier family 13 (sodium-dependent dicarboxylate transporter), member 2/3/5
MALGKLILILIIALLSFLIYYAIPLDKNVSKGLAILFLIAGLWITESLPVTITALLVPVISTLTGIFDIKSAFTNFAHPIIFLFLGGFALATALHKQRIDEFIADLILVVSKNMFVIAILILFLTTALISMWISNTATTAMMLPIALGLIYRKNLMDDSRLNTFILLGVAYSANIGGIGTLVGSPPNAITAANLGMNFRDWLYIGIPCVIVLFPVVICSLYIIQKPNFRIISNNSENPPVKIRNIVNKKSVTVILIFIFTVFLWLFSNPVSKFLNLDENFDSIVAVLSLILLVLFRTVEWKEIENFTDWGVLLLFGGGITLSAVLSETGASKYLATIVNNYLSQYGVTVLILGAVILMIFLTEVASNTASAAILVPIFLAVAIDIELSNQNLLPLTVGIAASCAFMLPVATPPNALVYGTGKIRQSTMIKIGFILNIICAVVITFIGFFLL